jgi:hypothetical protein
VRLKSRTRKKIAIVRFITSWIWLAVFVSCFVLKAFGHEVSGLDVLIFLGLLVDKLFSLLVNKWLVM